MCFLSHRFSESLLKCFELLSSLSISMCYLQEAGKGEEAGSCSWSFSLYSK